MLAVPLRRELPADVMLTIRLALLRREYRAAGAAVVDLDATLQSARGRMREHYEKRLRVAQGRLHWLRMELAGVQP